MCLGILSTKEKQFSSLSKVAMATSSFKGGRRCVFLAFLCDTFQEYVLKHMCNSTLNVLDRRSDKVWSRPGVALQLLLLGRLYLQNCSMQNHGHCSMFMTKNYAILRQFLTCWWIHLKINS